MNTFTLDPLSLIRNSGRAPSTVDQYTRAIKPFLDSGGRLSDVSAVAAYAETLGKSRRAHLRSAVSLWAKQEGQRLRAGATSGNVLEALAATMRLEALPKAIRAETPKGTKIHTWLTIQQVKDLYGSCGDDLIGLRDKVVLGLLVGAGLRRQELADLRWEHVYQKPIQDRMRTVVHTFGKGRKERDVPISDRLAAILDKWAAKAGRDGYVVRSLDRGELGDQLSSVGIFKIVQKHGADIGRPELAPHDLRRTYAQLGFDAGVPITQISILLGHSNVVVTQRYLNLDLDLKTTASDFIPFG